MKLIQSLCAAGLVVGVSAVFDGVNGGIRPHSVTECKTECDNDVDCVAGLLCADRHEKELAAAGYEKRKAYCGNKGKANYEVCYDPSKLGKVPNIPVPYTPPSPRIALCKADCDLDIDCADGLWCADEHSRELTALGLSDRFADCPDSARVGVPSNYEVCFDPKILKPPTPPGGGGDPHFRTHDGTKYSFHGQCDLVMARSPSFGINLGLDLHIRTEMVTDWSLIKNAVLRIGEDIFELANDGSYYFNGAKNVELPVHLAGEYEVTKTEETIDETTTRTHFIIKLGENDQSITMNLFKGMVSVRVDALLVGTEGMLGIHGTGGMVGRDRVTVFSDANMMGAEWQVRDNEPMLFHEASAPQFPAQCILPSTRSRRLREEDASAAKAACADVGEDMFDFCVQDVMITGDAQLANGYAYAF